MSALLAAYVAYLVLRPAGQSSIAIDGWGVDVFELAASVLCVIGGRRARPGSIVPIVLGLGVACWSLGDFALTVESLGGGSVPSPSPADVFYLLFFPLSYAGVVLIVRGETLRLSSPSWLDGAVSGLGAGAVCAAFAFDSIARNAHEPALAAAVNLAYPVGDVFLLLLVVGGTAVMSGRRKVPWWLLAVGFAINILGDTSNLLHHTLGGSQLATIADAVAWPTSTLLISLAMWLRPGPVDPLATRKPPGFLLPGLAAGAGLTVLFLSTLTSINRVANGLATATLLLVVVRTRLSVRHLSAQSNVRQRQSMTDPLTGLANRRRLFEALDGYFAQPQDDRPSLAFLFIDLNGFKRINDSFGHPAGDEVLSRVSVRLERSLRSTDLLARVGGDEFAAILVGAAADDATATAAQISASLDEPFHFDAVSASIGASIGIALASPTAADSQALMICADVAMYRAKLRATRFALYDMALDGVGTKLGLADELSAGIDDGQLLLHYQPQLDLRSAEITTVEALVRWRHPERGLIQPLSFLPLAEEAGLMRRLTRRVLAQALEQCAAWHSTGRRVRVSVNVSVGDLLDPELPAAVAALLLQTRLGPESLMLEVTETSIIDEFERAKHAVHRFRDLGILISIDDFGAGFTSLAYLTDLPVAEMKLDRRFITPLASDTTSRHADLVGATIELGHALGLDVVAEGVDDDRALDLLRHLGCDLAQGHGIARPTAAADVKFGGDHVPATQAKPTRNLGASRPLASSYDIRLEPVRHAD
ncbi:MAG: EAL domain-containing protein [Actinomycetota bacterium]|nr:EAL domain-containing protein [Actinomycetota bacterium]